MAERKEIFVFGSNTAGLHYGGAARYAMDKLGAEWGVGEGRTGEAYALPTIFGWDGAILETFSVGTVDYFVDRFIKYAKEHPELDFRVTRVGCGCAGLKDEDIAPLFKRAPKNCIFDENWRPFLGDRRNYFTF